MLIARQSTARTVTVGPVLDADGVAVTNGVVGDFKISKNGAAPAALNGSATLTHRHTGHYSLALTASDLDTVGTAEVVIDDTVNACPMKEISVLEEAVYDLLYAAGATGNVTLANGAHTITNLTLTGALTVQSGVTFSNTNGHAFYLSSTGGDPGYGLLVESTDEGVVVTAGANAVALMAGGNGSGITATGSGSGSGMSLTAGGTGDDLKLVSSDAPTLRDAVWTDGTRILTAATNITDTGGAIDIDASGRVLLQPTQTGVTIPTVTTVGTATTVTTVNGLAANTITASALAADAVAEIWGTALAEAYKTAGATGTGAQILYEILQNLTDSVIVGTTKTVRKLDGTPAKTYTLDSATVPTSITETT